MSIMQKMSSEINIRAFFFCKSYIDKPCSVR